MNKLNERLLQLRKATHLNQTEFGYKLGVTIGVIKNLEGDKTTPNDEFIDLVCRIYAVNKNWLVNGNGDMFLDDREVEMFALIDKHHLSEKEAIILENYLNMDESKRKTFVDVLMELTGQANNHHTKTDDETPQVIAARSGKL